MTTLTGSPRTAARQLCEKLGLQETQNIPEDARKWEEFERKSIASLKARVQENVDLFKEGLCSFHMEEDGKLQTVAKPPPPLTGPFLPLRRDIVGAHWR